MDFSRVRQIKTAMLSSLSVLGLILITVFIKGLADGIKHTHSTCKQSQARRDRKQLEGQSIKPAVFCNEKQDAQIPSVLQKRAKLVLG